MPSASVIKIPILLSLLDSKDKKQVKLSEKYKLQPNDIVGGSGDIQFETPFKSLTYLFLAQKMIGVSDNTATNIIIEKLGMQQIQQNIDDWQLKDTHLNRKMMDFQSIYYSSIYYHTAGAFLDVMHIYEAEQWLSPCRPPVSDCGPKRLSERSRQERQ